MSVVRRGGGVKRFFAGIAVAGLALVTPVLADSVEAQIAPDTPRLISPHGPGSGALGIHWMRGGTLPGDGDAILFTWAPGVLPDGVRLRGGSGRGYDEVISGFGGIDVQTPFIRGEGDTPVDLDWYAGLGVGAGKWVLVTLPAGISAGVEWGSGSVWMSPYVSAGLAADLRLGEEAPGDEFRVYPAVDIGMDIAFDSARRFVLRGAASFGDRQTLAAGVSIGGR